MIKILDDASFANDDIIIINKYSNNVTFFDSNMGILSANLDKINLDNVNLNEDDPETIVHVRLIAWHNIFKCKPFKKDIGKELMPAAWHPTRWWDWCMPKDEKEGTDTFVIDEK